MNRPLFRLGIVFALQSRPDHAGFERGYSMDPKLTLLFLLIGTVVGLSHLSEENLTRMRRQLVARRWRELVRLPRKF
jgi:hypothetical protein